MTDQEWIERARQVKPQLLVLVQAWHPAASTRADRDGFEITASLPEEACEQFRKEIAEKFSGEPCQRLEQALAAGDIGTVSSILNQAWIGVPESTNCWRIPGFEEAVSLLEDMPEPEED